MYRLMLYFLIVLVVAAVVYSFFGKVPFQPIDLVFSVFVLIVVSWLTNKVFSRIFVVPSNVESVYITSLILAMIITPPAFGTPIDWSSISFLAWVAGLSMASKYILTIRGKHIFNPAAFAVALTAFTISQSASWWVGTQVMLPFVLIGGLLVTRKIQRFDLVFSFIILALATTILSSPSRSEILFLLKRILADSPVIFFALVMLTEPLTTPPTRFWRISYGLLIGLIFGPRFHIGTVYSTPELALLLGNIFSYLVSPKAKYLLTLQSAQEVGKDIYDYVFSPSQKPNFQPGQYLEWTLGHKNSDTRGNRRYFTIASSPTENEIHLGVKFYPNSSSFKTALRILNSGNQVLAGQLAGEFTMPKNFNDKLTFIAGGIGITPFRSMIKYLLDRHEKRDIVLYYCCKTADELAFKDIFDQAVKQLGIKVVYVIADQSGFLTADLIKQQSSDYQLRHYYISGPRGMVVAFKNTLKSMGISGRHIKIDFFPGYV